MKTGPSKRRRQASLQEDDSGFFDKLPKEIVLFILGILAASASSPSDLLSITSTCTKLRYLGLDHSVLAKASPRSLAIRAKSWSESAHRFFTRCADSGNLEASYILGMIRFYCLHSRQSGAALIKTAAKGSHAEALYSLAVIQFNSSGRLAKTAKHLTDGVKCAAAAGYLGHVGALWEVGICLSYGYGVKRNLTQSRHYLIAFGKSALASLFLPGVLLPLPEPHPANRFLVEWFEAGRAEVGEGLRLCSFEGCGRPETRPNEFMPCQCGMAKYCTNWCQLLGWMSGHFVECVLMRLGYAGGAAQVEGGSE